MKIFLLSLLTISFLSCANRAVYKSPDLEAQSLQHQNIAILPVKITQTGHVPKNVTEEEIIIANEKWSYIFQESLHSYILKQTSRNKKGQVVAFQALQKTNAILKENGLTTEDLYSKSPEDLAELLQVDAVLMTTLDKDKNFSDGVAYGLAAGRTALNVLTRSAVGLPWINSSDIKMNCYLYDAGDSKLLWKTYRTGGTDLPSNVDGVIDYFSNWIAKKLPYRS